MANLSYNDLKGKLLDVAVVYNSKHCKKNENSNGKSNNNVASSQRSEEEK